MKTVLFKAIKKSSLSTTNLWQDGLKSSWRKQNRDTDAAKWELTGSSKCGKKTQTNILSMTKKYNWIIGFKCCNL